MFKFGDEFHKENLHFRSWNFGEWLNLVLKQDYLPCILINQMAWKPQDY